MIETANAIRAMSEEDEIRELCEARRDHERLMRTYSSVIAEQAREIASKTAENSALEAENASLKAQLAALQEAKLED